MTISAKTVKELRDKTGAGMMDCKKALNETDGDIEKAITYLREKGISKAAKRAGRETAEGIIYSYIHPGSKLGVMIEIDCETDFVARNEEFQGFAKDIAMQIAASNPIAISREDIDKELIEKERDIYRQLALNEGKPEKIIDKIVDGKIEKYFAESCLLEQPFVKDSDRTMQDILTELIAKIGENVTIKRFARFMLGQ
ncbi:MAG: translation elongation factor Ts [candidate division Zixibacteria bacterium]|nr:translation elongation factor Ts [candidate division Zixibacteria bacterium]